MGVNWVKVRPQISQLKFNQTTLKKCSTTTQDIEKTCDLPVGSLSSVHPSVAFQGVATRKGFAAHLAHERFLSGVHRHVDFQINGG